MRTGGEQERRPEAAVSAPTPAPSNAVGVGAAALLSLQRRAGNAAVCRTLAGGDGVVRRAWLPGARDGVFRWDAPVTGLRWSRRVERGKPDVFSFVDETPSESPADALIHEGDWKTAAEWARLPDLWASLQQVSGSGAALAHDPEEDIPPPKQQPAQQPAAPQHQTAPNQGAAAAATAPQAPQPARWVTTDPKVKPAGPPDIRPASGTITWVARFKVKEIQPEDSWVVQKVVPLGGAPFWEAFRVPAGEQFAAAEDTFYKFDTFTRPGGLFVEGQIRHCVVPGGGPPPGMAFGGVAEAGGLPSSRNAPTGWQDGGTPHVLAVLWEPASERGAAPDIRVRTVPDTRTRWEQFRGGVEELAASVRKRFA